MGKSIQSPARAKVSVAPAIFTGDWHYGHDRERQIYGKTQNDQIDDALDMMLEYASRNGIENIFGVGDIFDKKRPTPDDELRFIKFINKCISWKIHFHVFSGNHEANELGATIFDAYREMYAGHEYIHVYTKPYGFGCGDGVFYYIVPHIHAKDLRKGDLPISQAEYLNDVLKEIDRKVETLSHKTPFKRRYLLMHAENEKALPGAEKLLLANSANELMSNDFEAIRNRFKIDAIISGHIHKAQILDETFYYTGSLICNDISEADDAKGFVELTEQGALRFKALTVQKWKRLYLDLKNSRRKTTYTIDELKTAGLKEIVEQIDGVYAHVVVRYPASQRELINFDEIKEYIKENSDAQFELRREVLDDKIVKQVKSAMTNMTPKQAVTSWIERYFEGTDETDEFKKETEAHAVRIMEKNI